MHLFHRNALVTSLAVLATAGTLLAHGSGRSRHASCKGDGYVISQAGRTVVRGCSADFDEIGKLKKKFDGAFVLFSRGNHSWVIQDPAWVKRADDAFSANPSMKAAHKQMRAQERTLAKQEREIERSVSKIEREIDRLEDEENDHDRVALQKVERELEAKAKEMEKEARELEAVARKLEREYEKMEVEADGKLERLFSQAIATGVAKKVQ